MTAIDNRMRATLLNLKGKTGKHLIESMCNLSDLLEHKSDPDQNELYILENLYKVQESLNLLVENLEKHNNGVSIFNHPGSKLSELFQKNGTFE